MRNPSMRRTFAGAAILALTTMGLAACGGDGGSGADDKTVTILSSVDQPVQDGLEETLTAKLKADGSYDQIYAKYFGAAPAAAAAPASAASK